MSVYSTGEINISGDFPFSELYFGKNKASLLGLVLMDFAICLSESNRFLNGKNP